MKGRPSKAVIALSQPKRVPSAYDRLGLPYAVRKDCLCFSGLVDFVTAFSCRAVARKFPCDCNEFVEGLIPPYPLNGRSGFRSP